MIPVLSEVTLNLHLHLLCNAIITLLTARKYKSEILGRFRQFP